MNDQRSSVDALRSTIKELPIEILKDLQSTINGLLKSVAVTERIKRRKPGARVRLDDATQEQLLEERAYLEASWDPVFNIDRDRMIDGALEVEYEVYELPKILDGRFIKHASPILHDKVSKRNPPEHVALEFFKQFLDCERADKRYNGISPEMLLTGYKEYVKGEESPRLWGYINDIDEYGISLTDSATGKVLIIDISDAAKELFEDMDRHQEGKPKIIRRKPYEEEDVYERVHRKYRVTE